MSIGVLKTKLLLVTKTTILTVQENYNYNALDELKKTTYLSIRFLVF